MTGLAYTATKLFPWQEEAADWMAPRTGALLGLAPGLGKTATAIAAAEQRALKLNGPKGLGVLAVVPLSLLGTWRREIGKWSKLPATVRVIHGNEILSQDSHNMGAGESPRIRWTVTNYDTVMRMPVQGRFGLLVCDESVMLKNRNAKRVKKMREIRKAAGACWLLSGAPKTKYIDDIWTQLNMAVDDPKEAWKLGSYWRFADRYCTIERNQFGWHVDQDRTGAYEQFKKDFASCFWARSQNDVANIPEWLEEEIEVPMLPRQWKMYDQMEQEALAELPDGNELLAPNHLAMTTRLLQIASNPLLVQGVNESGKWNALAEVLEYAPKPTLVWTSYIATANLLSAKYKAPAMTGQTKTADRDRIVDDLQNGKLDVVFAHPGVGKFGYTMTKARSSVYLERTYNGDDYLQSLYRIRRIGTVEAPVVYRILATAPDDVVAQRKRRSTATVDHVIDTVLHRKTAGTGELTSLAASDFDILRRAR
jgi:SNF2 family DNA or RNA helicase